MKERSIYRQLERPWLYRLSQTLLAPGNQKAIMNRIGKLLTHLPPATRILDVGCGPSSWLWQAGLRPIGLDLSVAYTASYNQQGGVAVTGSAAALPFSDNTFDGVWSIALLHHLPDDLARQTVNEMLRVCRPHGYIAIFDAVLPEPAWHRPLAYALRRLDRGKFMRRENELKNLLPPRESFGLERFTYTYNGLEAVLVHHAG